MDYNREGIKIILSLFITFLALALILIVIGLAKSDESAMALIGFTFLFILSFQLIDGDLQYEAGYNETYIYGNNFTGYHWDYDFSNPVNPNSEFLFHRNTSKYFVNYQNQALGYWLAVCSVAGFVGVLIGIRGGWKPQ